MMKSFLTHPKPLDKIFPHLLVMITHSSKFLIDALLWEALYYIQRIEDPLCPLLMELQRREKQILMGEVNY